MSSASYDMIEIRFIIKSNFTECYVFCEAVGDCPIGVQGWHYKVFDKAIPVNAIKYWEDCVLWAQKSPESEVKND